MKLEDLIETLNMAREKLLTTAESAGVADPEALIPSPNPDRWSAVDVLDHVDRTESKVAALLGKLTDRAGSRGKLRQTPMVSVPLNTSYTDAIPRFDAVPAFPGTEPVGDRTFDQITRSLAVSRAGLLELAEFGGNWDCSKLIAPHFVGRLNFYEWLFLIAEHDRIHTEQIRERYEKL